MGEAIAVDTTEVLITDEAHEHLRKSAGRAEFGWQELGASAQPPKSCRHNVT